MEPQEDPIAQFNERIAPYKLPLLLGAVSLLSLLAAVSVLFRQLSTREPLQIIVNDSTDLASDSGKLVVDISGAVISAGVYRVNPDDRIIDVIQAAGGLTADVDKEKMEKTLNLALKVKDGMKIYIPRIESDTSHNDSNEGDAGANTSHNLVEDSEGSSAISINFASKSDLVGLAGIGDVTAQKIINNRPYSSIEELVTRKILSKALFEKLKSQLSL